MILTDSHLDTRIERCILMNGIATKLAHVREVWEGSAKVSKTVGNGTDDSSWKKKTMMLKYD